MCRESRMPTVICRRCDKPFHTKPSNNAVYCSRECRKNRVTIICKACNKPFKVRGKFRNRIYCSRKCYIAACDVVFQESRATKSCKWCGNTFEVALSRAKKRAYCSRECRTIGVKDVQVEKHVAVVCEYCKKQYTLRQCYKRARNYCSRKCKHADGRVTFPCKHCGIGLSPSRGTRLLAGKVAASVLNFESAKLWHGEKSKVFPCWPTHLPRKNVGGSSRSFSSETNLLWSGTGWHVRKTRRRCAGG